MKRAPPPLFLEGGKPLRGGLKGELKGGLKGGLQGGLKGALQEGCCCLLQPLVGAFISTHGVSNGRCN